VNISPRLCKEPFPFASSALATLWCHQVLVGHQDRLGQSTVIRYPPSHATWWASSTTILAHILSSAGEPWSLWLLLVWKPFHSSEDPGYPCLNLFPSSHICDEDRCALCRTIPAMRCQRYLCSCKTSLASSASQHGPALLLLPHSSSSPLVALLYLGLDRGCCTFIPLPVIYSDDAHHLCG